MMTKTEENKHAGILRIEERNDTEFDYGFTFELFPEQLDCIRNGDIEGLRNTFHIDMYDYYEKAIPDLSAAPAIFNFLNGCVMMLANEAGIPLRRTVAVSTKYLRQTQQFTSVNDFVDRLRDMQMEYTEEVYLFKRNASGNQVIDTCQRYIYEHVYDRITLKELEEITGYSTSRLQHLFTRYKGIPITEHIRKEKIERACYLLRNTDLSCAAISQKLSYCSQSYFIQQFQKETGITPARYRAGQGV